jgi:acetyl-CoA carboxylase biotin carboxyl carrier protein
MELKQMKELMAAMERAGIKKLRIKEKTGFELDLERQDESPPHHPTTFAQPVYHEQRFAIHPPPYHPKSPIHEDATQGQQPAAEPKAEGKYVKSPMVGTFYATPSPEDPAFVKVGDRVEENTVVCIIEAMKVMNEVKAGISGVVAEICVENGHPVEFGTKIFRIT